MSRVSIDEIAAQLSGARVTPSGVSFAGKGLKLDTEQDAQVVVDEIDKTTELQFLNLEGNTLGVDASKAIAKALEKHPEFKRALWKDMFTGRMKTEIPKALVHLGDGLVAANARLTELDLSDNAFGPIGVEGLASLLRSSSCYALEELRLNNNGLGITGGKLLASALTDCYNKSKAEGKPLALKVFIAGRNRLENEGAKALAAVFKLIGTLEEIAMPQNGIYHVGITALSEAFTHNKNLQILNLNDNTIGEKGALAIAKALPQLQSLREINFGDCLLKSRGASLLALGLKSGHDKLVELILGHNEIKSKSIAGLVDGIANKKQLKSLVLDGNQFGEEGRNALRQKLKEIGKVNVLGSLSEDESEDSEEEEEVVSEVEEEEEEEEELEVSVTISASDFLNTPSASNFLALGGEPAMKILPEIKVKGSLVIDSYMSALMKVGSLCGSTQQAVAEGARKCTEFLYKELFVWAEKSDNVSLVNNTLLINLGLLKSEDKKAKITWNLDGCFKSIEHISEKNFIPESTKDTFKVFLQRDVRNNGGEHLQTKKQILSQLK